MEVDSPTKNGPPPGEDNGKEDDPGPTFHHISCNNEVIGTYAYKEFAKLFNNPLFSDIQLQLTTGEKIQCHKIILCAWSSELANAISKSPNTLEVNFDPEIVKIFLRLLYEGKSSVATSQVLSLLELAALYDVEAVKCVCADLLFEQQQSNISYLLDISRKYKARKLETNCANHFAEHFADLLQDSPEQLMKLEPTTWVELLKKDKIEVLSEQKLFEAVLQYVKAKNPKASPARDELLTMLLPQIRFSLMMPEYLVGQVEKNEMVAHLPILPSLLYDAFRWKSLPPALKKKHDNAKRTVRTATRFLWSSEHKNYTIQVTDDQLTAKCNMNAVYQSIRTSTGFKSGGKHYFEVTLVSKGTWLVFGVCDTRFDCSNTVWVNSYRSGNTWLYHHDYGSFWMNGTAQPRNKPITAMSNGSVIGVLVDLNTNEIVFTLNGVVQGDPFKGVPTDQELFPFITGYQGTTVTINVPPIYSPPE